MSRLAEAVVVLTRLFSMNGWQLAIRHASVVKHHQHVRRILIQRLLVKLESINHRKVPGIKWWVRYLRKPTEDGHMTA